MNRPSFERDAGDVSVVVNLHDEPIEFVLEAISSVKAQTLRAAEIIAVEDGSRRDFSAVWRLHSDVRVIRQENQGLAAARNAGLLAARCEFILFLDGDDRLLPHAIATVLGGFHESPDAAMVYGGWRGLDCAGRPQPQASMAALGSDAYATLLTGNCIGMHATVIYRRELLARVGGFDRSYPVCEDYELYLRLARQVEVRSVPDVVAEYRQHAANISRDYARMLDGVLKVLAAQEPHVHARLDWIRKREDGVAGWKTYYAEQFLGAGPPRRPSRTVRKWMQLSRRMPWTMIGGAMRLASRSVRDWFARGRVSFGDLRRTTPISTHFGFDRGRPVDRYYIEAFLLTRADDIRGRVLEVGDATYTGRFGGAGVTLSEVLHVNGAATKTTYATDLSTGAGIPDDTFDCVILTQTLHLIFDVGAALATLHRILKPGGCLLLTVPGVSSVDRGEWQDTWYWSFTAAALGRSLEAAFGPGAADIDVRGNVLSATAFLYGLADHELTAPELDAIDPHYPVIVTARVRKGHGTGV